MRDEKDIAIRDARDRMIDLLGFGETYPLQDLSILDDQLTVPFNVSAKIPIEDSQLQVSYQLFDSDDLPVRSSVENEPITAEGLGALLVIESPKILDDITYKIQAKKDGSGREVYLHETATIKVGLDSSLSAFIRDIPFLEPIRDILNEDDARIMDYGSRVQVVLKKSQEGVDYRLVSLNGTTETVLSESEVRGTFDDIVLSAQALYEDTDIRIRATKAFDVSEGRETQTDLLDVILPLKIRANTALQVSIDPDSIIDFAASTTLKIEASQKSVSYRVYSRKIADADFVFDEKAGQTLVSVTGSDGGVVKVAAPEAQVLWQLPKGFTALGPQKQGTGSALSFPISALSNDTLFIVQAEKNHQGLSLVSSAMKLSQAAVVLLRPDIAIPLHFRVTVRDAEAVGPVEVLAGESGVFYQLRTRPSGPDLGLPAYFHKKDALNPEQNKGIAQVRIGIDFVVPRAEAKPSDARDPATRPPASAELILSDIALGESLNVLAIKAQTQIDLLIPKTLDLPVLPNIAFDSVLVEVGQTARLVVSTSVVGEKYQLFLNGEAVKQAKNGNGSDLVFITETLSEDTLFELYVTQPASDNLQVTRIVPLRVDVNK